MPTATSQPFIRPRFNAIQQNENEEITSLPNLIAFNVKNNPNHVFCLQAEANKVGTSTRQHDTSDNLRAITFKQLGKSIANCAKSLEELGISNKSPQISKCTESPVALYLESDVTLFIYIATLLALNIPIVLLSARLSPASVQHLVTKTQAQLAVVSRRTRRGVEDSLSKISAVENALTYHDFLDCPDDAAREDGFVDLYLESSHSQNDDPNQPVLDLILHSSGTTGMPKPIRLAQRYLLAYAACHFFSEKDEVDWINLSTLPLYHGFGMLAPSLSLSVGLACCFPRSSQVPAAHSTLELLSLCQASSLMTVPSILEDVLALPDVERTQALSMLASLKFIAVGGGPMKAQTGEELVASGVSLLNHYGVTEIGPIAPIFIPGDDYDWRYLRLRSDLKLELKSVPSTGDGDQTPRFKLVGHPFGWSTTFEIQDDIVKRPVLSKHVEIKILGRRDAVIVLKTGEKVSPNLLEETLSKDENIKSAVCLGDGFFELAVLVEASPSASSIPKEDFREQVWEVVSTVNKSMDEHARISSKRAIVIKPANKQIPRSDKGSIMRREVYQVFREEIETAYASLETVSFDQDISITNETLETSLTHALQSVMSGKFVISTLSTNDDFFELGMDSLQATRLSRLLNSIVSKIYPDTKTTLTKDFVYKNSSIARITAVLRAGHPQPQNIANRRSQRAEEIEAFAKSYLDGIQSSKAVVILTGSTGSLGVHSMISLAKSNRTQRIICLNRGQCGDTTDLEELRLYRHQLIERTGVPLTKTELKKIEVLNADMQATDLGLPFQQYCDLLNTVTHILHLAWPMDFNRSLESYRPQLRAVEALTALCRDIHHSRPACKPRLLFSSSISVVRHYGELTGQSLVPEIELEDPSVTALIGYAEAKWVCEKMLERAGTVFSGEFEPLIVRIGQLSGPESTEGLWKTEEHIPTLVKASQTVAAFPILKGNFSWTPVDRAAHALRDILLQRSPSAPMTYHLENPIRQPLADFGAVVMRELGIRKVAIPYSEWLDRVIAAGCATSLERFFREDFETLANGSLTLDTAVARGVSGTMRGSVGISQALMVKYLATWKEAGYLSDKNGEVA